MAAQDVQGMLVRIEATTAQLRAEMKRADAAVGNATKGIDKQLSKVDGAFGRLETGAGKAAAAIRTLAPALAGLATIEALRRTQQLGEEFTLLEARVKRLSGGTAEAAVTYARLAEVARNSGTSLGETVKLWESLTGTLQEMGATDAQVVRLTDTLQKIGTIGGSSAQEVSNALRQLGQGLAGGVLRAEEFNSVIEGMPELAREIARGLGVPFGELRQMMLDGELTADKVLGAIQRRAYDVDAEFAKLPRTVSQASAALTNDLGRAISSLDSAIGGSQFLAKFLDTLAKGIRLTAGDLTDFERLNELVAERAQIQLRYEQAQRRTLLSDERRATWENRLKRLNAEIAEIQDRRIAQIKEEGREISANAPVINEQYDKYLAKLKESAALQGVNSEVAKVRYAIEKGELGTLTEAQQAALLKYAEEKDAKIEAQKAGLDYSQSLKEQAKALQDLANKYDPAAKAQAEYEKGIKLADEALLNGEYTTEQYQKVVQGLYTDLNKPIWDKHNKAAEDAAEAIKKIDDQLESVRDRLDPVRAATKRLTAEKKLLKEGLDAGSMSLEEYQLRLQQLDDEYKENTRATSEWAKWTEGALDRVDSAFADAWRNIGDGFSSFRDSLTNAFKQMLAELAHMAITRPIVLQLGAMMGVGNGTQGNNGIWGGLLGGGSSSGGGNSIAGIANQANNIRSLYSMYGAAQTLWPVLQGGFANGGFSGALGAAGSYFGGMLGIGSGAAASSAAGSVASGYTGAAMANWVAAQTANTAATTTLSATISGALTKALSGMTSMLTNPYTWIAAGMLGSAKAYDAGYRADASKMAQAGGSNAILQGAAWTQAGQSKFFEILDKGLTKLSFGLVNDKLAAIISGSSFHQMLWEGLIFGRLFGSGEKYKRTVGSAQGVYSAGEYTGMGAVESWFNGSRRFGDDFDKSLHDLNEAFSTSLGGLFEMFDIDSDIMTTARTRLRRTSGRLVGDFIVELDDQVLKSFNQYGGKGNVQKGMQQFFDRVMGDVLAKAIGISQLPEYLKEQVEGLKKAEEVSAAISGLFQRFDSVNTTIETLNLSAFALTDAGLRGADALLDLTAAIAGLEDPTTADKIASLTSLTSNYYDQFFTAAEKTEDTLNAVARAFEAADIKLASNRAEYRAMVEDIDLTTEAGREMFATLMALSGQAAQYYDILDARAAEAINAAGTAFSALQAAVGREVAQLQTQYQAAQASANGLLQLSNSLQSALRSMRMDTDQFDRMRRQQAQAQLSAALAVGRAGGSLQGMDLSDALSELGRDSTQFYGTFEEYARDYWKTANDINSLDQLTGKQLSVEEKTLAALENQFAYFDQMLLDAQNELNALMGIDTSVQSVAAALANFKLAVGAAETAKNAAAPKTAKQTIADTYQSVFGRDAGSGEVNYWLQRIGEGTATTGNLADLFKTSDEYKRKVPGFASGGFHSGGLRLVGENGPELEVTGPSRIYNASQTAAMLSGAGSTEELRALRSEVAGLRSALGAIAKYTESTAYGVRQMNEIGLPQGEAA